MTEQRPKYGEYATPEEQRRLAGLPPLDAVAEPPVAAGATPLPGTAAPGAAAPGTAASVTAAPGTAASGTAAPGTAASGTRPRQGDRIATIALLAYGLINVITSAASYLDLPTVMNETMRILGVEREFTNFAQGRLWGTVAAIVLVVGWGVTAALSIRRLRRGKLAWWVPLVGAVATMFVVMICITVPMLGDPAFLEHVASVGTP